MCSGRNFLMIHYSFAAAAEIAIDKKSELNRKKARQRFGSHTQWRPLREALTNELGLDDMFLAWLAVGTRGEVGWLWGCFRPPRCFFLCFNLVLLVLCVFSVLLALRLSRLVCVCGGGGGGGGGTAGGGDGAGCFTFVCSICVCLVMSVSSSSWCLERAAVCDCGTLWTFHLPFFCCCSTIRFL